MIIYEPRRNRKWVEKYITIESVEHLKKLITVSIMTGGCFEIETEEEAQMLSKLLLDLEPPFDREVMRALDAFKTVSEILSSFGF